MHNLNLNHWTVQICQDLPQTILFLSYNKLSFVSLSSSYTDMLKIHTQAAYTQAPPKVME